MIINNFENNNIDRNISQMEQWSILSNVINYVQYEGNPRDYFKLDIKALEENNYRMMYNWLKEEGKEIIELDFGNTPDKLNGEYLDMHDGVKSKVLCTTKFNENSNLSTTYLGRIDMTRSEKKDFLYQNKDTK